MSPQDLGTPPSDQHVRAISIGSFDLTPKPWRPGNFQRAARLGHFVESVREHGLLIEPKCRTSHAGMYEPITGLQAIMAAHEAGASHIKCVVSEMDDASATIAAFHAQLAESEPNGLVMEKAWAIRNLEEQLLARGERASYRAIAARIGRSKSFVEYSLLIAKALPRDRFLAIAAEEGIPESVAVTLPKATAVRIAKAAGGDACDLARLAVHALDNKRGTSQSMGHSHGSGGMLSRIWQYAVNSIRRLVKRLVLTIARVAFHRPRARVHQVDSVT